MRILVWPVHGGWMNAFARGRHDYLLPVGGAGPTGLPPAAHTVDPAQLSRDDVDVVVLQRPEELESTREILGCEPGREVPAVFVEHNTPARPADQRHPLAGQNRIPIVHVTHFNRLMWDSGHARTVVIEHGIPDPGNLYTGEIPALGVVVNEPVRRGRATGTDLLPAFARKAPLHAFGIDTELLPDALDLGPDRLQIIGDLPMPEMHAELARRRAYLHPMRWTSLGLSLLEAMSLGMPVLVLDTTEASRAVPEQAGAISADPDELGAMADVLLHDPGEARRRGAAARAFAQERYGLLRFLHDWDGVLTDAVEDHHASAARML